MKTNLILLMLILGLTNSYAQICNQDEEKTKLLTEILSKEDTNQSGTLKYYLKIKALDTLVVDSIIIKSNYFNSFSHNSNFHFTMFEGDSAMIEITINYNQNALPFYYKSIDHYVLSHKDSTLNSTHLSAANIYFTPYGTTEVWNMEDFYSLPRIWNLPDSLEPQRVYIHKDSLPISNLTYLDTNHQKWEEDFQHKVVPNLPYAILMKAIHPDTLSMYYTTDTSILDSIVNPNSFTIYKRFKGVVVGQLKSRYINDEGAYVNGGIPLGGVKVILKSDGLFNKNLKIDYTDDNGNFRLEYDVITFLDGDQIELFLKFESDCDKFNFKVKERFDWFDDNPYSFRWHIGKHGKQAGTIDVKTIELSDDMSYPYRITNWTYLMYRFFENEVPDFLPKKKLKIKLFGQNSQFLTANFNIILNENSERHESTIWHELGHYVMEVIQPNSLCKSSGNHSINEENNIHLAWSEGWATGFMSILDFYYSNFDNELNIKTHFEGGINPSTGKESRTNFEKRNKKILNDGNKSNGIRSEFLIACLLRDLFDGPKFNLNPNNYLDLGSSFTTPLDNDGYDFGLSDIVELDANTIFNALSMSNHSIFEYYNKLLLLINDCENRKYIKQVFDQNRISLNTDDILFSDNVVSTDEICVISTFTDPEFTNSCFLRTDFFSDRNTLDGNTNSYNLAFESNIPLGFEELNENIPFFNKNISDNLKIKNNAVLSFNKSIKSRFSFQNIGSIPPPTSLINSTICSDLIAIENNGTVELGDKNGTTKASVILNSGSVIELNSTLPQEPSKLIINDNSILVINEGASLKLYPNSQIILNGPNAVLEIRGEIQLYNGAALTYVGGNEGKGFIRFISSNSNNPNLVNSPTNNGFVNINGVNSNKSLEIIGATGLRIGSDIKDFIINNSQIKMGLNSRLKIEAKENIEIKNSTFDRLFSNDQYHGILILPSSNNEINNVNINNSKTALTAYNLSFGFMSNNSLNINKINIKNCEIGILINASSVIVKNAIISEFRQVGIKSISQNLPNKLSYVKIISSPNAVNADGIILEGNSVANSLTTMDLSRIENNRIGTFANMATLKLLKCNNYLSNNLGIEMNGWSILDKSNLSYTKFDANTTHFLSRFHGTLQMMNGHNAYFGQNPNNLQTVFWASLQPPQPNIINTNQINATSNFFEAPLTYSIFNPNCWLDERGTRALTFGNVNNTYNNLSQYIINNPCGYIDNDLSNYSEEISIYDGFGNAFSVPTYDGLNGTNINCSPFNGSSIIAAYKPLHDSIYLSKNPNVSQILPQLCSILNCYVINPSDLHQQLLVDVFNTTVLAHSRGILNKNVGYDSTGVDSLSNLFVNTIDNLIISSVNNNYPWKRMLFELKIAKTEVQRLANQRVTAINNLEDLQDDDLDSFELELVARNLCIHNAELALINGTVSIENMYDVYPCYSFQNTQSAIMLRANKIQDKEELKLIFYPNPSNNEIFVTTSKNEKISGINIYNLEGKLILSFNKANEDNHLYNIQSLATGTYILEVTTESNKYNKLIIKQ